MKRMLLFVCLFLPTVVMAEDENLMIGDTPLSTVLKQLSGQNRGLQVRAARTLIDAPAELRPKLMPLMMPLLKSERENDRFVAAQVLGQCGPAAKAATTDLLAMLEGTQFERNRAAAAKALGQIHKDAPASEEAETVTRGLMKLFTDRYSDVRREAAVACGMIGPAAKSCIPELPVLYDDAGRHAQYGGDSSAGESYLVHSAALWTTGRMGPLAACHMDRLISILHSDGDISTTAVWAIGEIGAVNDNIVPNLMKCLEKKLYGQYGGFNVGALSFCVGEITQGTTQEYRDFVFNVLAKFGPKSVKAVPMMNRLISEGDWYNGYNIRNAIGALKVLRAVGPDAGEALPALEKAAAIKLTRFDERLTEEVANQFMKEAQSALAAVKGVNRP